MTAAKMMTHEEQTVFYLRGVLWLPHYKIKNAYVSPGRFRYRTAEQLMSEGAIPQTLELWPRRYE